MTATSEGRYRFDQDGYLVDNDGSLIYFVQEMAGQRRIKIGRTRSLRSRFPKLQTGSPEPLEVIHTEPGGSKREAYFHTRWARHRYRKNGEWFDPAPSILNYVASAPAGRRGHLRPSLPDVPWATIGRALGVAPRGGWRIIVGLFGYAFTRKKKYARPAWLGGAATTTSAGAYFGLDPALAVPAIVLVVLAACLVEGSR